MLFNRNKEKKTDEKILELYRLLTRSDMNGYYEDTFVVEMLFAILVLDLVINAESPAEMSAKEMYDLAKEILRIYEREDNTFSYHSLRAWTEATLNYMQKNEYAYDDIFKKNTYDLREEVRQFMKKDDE